LSKSGHFLTAAALAYALYERSASPPIALGTLLGSSFPDVGELVRFRGRRRSSLIPHRTLTHWIPLYIVVIVAMPLVLPGLPRQIVDFVSGMCMASILHIALDMLSPAGIPILNPFGARVSLGLRRHAGKPCLYRTGTLEELPIVTATVLAIVFLAAPYPAPFSLWRFEAQSLNLLGSYARAMGTGIFHVARRLGETR
jgi:inner membrane protein